MSVRSTIPGSGSANWQPPRKGQRSARPVSFYRCAIRSAHEEAWFVIGAAAIARGYNVIAFDEPGQGTALRDDGLVFHPDWGTVMASVFDYAWGRPEFASDKVVHADAGRRDVDPLPNGRDACTHPLKG
ncbi:hypothetical protein ACUTJJ_14875 [Agrobacterium sp. DKPNP3]|uniref:hypothetical protein n=1 Tax=Agrobacterium sp. DKPNP3 TaxID=3457323 RepID=UPI00404430AE